MPQVTPVFMFCLPRSGSTLVQRVLASRPEVATTAEPWLLLPFLYTLRERGLRGVYDHHQTGRAVQQFIGQLPEGTEQYREALRRFVLDLYGGVAGEDARLFLDKTPIYHLIPDEIVDTFPDAKFVFLWRHPLSVAVSNIRTFGYGRWLPQNFRADLFNGLDRLLDAYARHGDNAIAVRYEDLVTGDTAEWQRLFAHLDLEFAPEALREFADVELEGQFQDPTGRRLYRALSTEPMDKWKQTIVNPVRREWCRRYVDWIGEARLAVMGYDRDAIMADLDALPMSTARVRGDVLDIVRSLGRRRLREDAIRHTSGSSAWRYLYDTPRPVVPARATAEDGAVTSAR